jgi:hypothetical protein
MAVGLRTGAAPRLSGATIEVGAPAQPADYLLGDYLRKLFGTPRVVVAFGGSTGPYRKPVLQVFGVDGLPLGYVKVGWNDWSRAAVRREAEALQAASQLAGGGREAGAGPVPARLAVPALLDHRQIDGLEVVATAPMPRGVRRLSRAVPDAQLIGDISRLSPPESAELAASSWWTSVQTRIAELTETGPVGSDPGSSWLVEAADAIEARYGSAPLSFGRWHGDLVQWNLAALGDRIYAFDWESSAAQAPVGLDAIHFCFQTAFVEDGVPVGQASALAGRQAAASLLALGIARDQHDVLRRVHLLELAIRHEQARASTGESDARFAAGIRRLLVDELTGPAELAS